VYKKATFSYFWGENSENFEKKYITQLHQPPTIYCQSLSCVEEYVNVNTEITVKITNRY